MRMSGSKKKILYSILFIFIAIFCLVVIMPFFIMVTTAFKSSKELTLANFRIFPEKLLFSNFSEAMRKGDWVRYFVNSTIVTVITVAASLFFNSLAGYSLARLKFKGRQLILIIFIIGIMIPPQSCLIPQFIILKSFPLAGGNDIWGKGGIGLLNSYAGLIIPFVSGSFGVFLCRQFYLSFPRDLDDAATIDGCSKFMTYRIF
jgi:multiple sugar transport system permease protein